ncbi:C4-dicarboxylate TRAP transporter substrate-binding protein [Vibrio viridaestus]|uniref:C4-dicarboxylate ABC transporter substrate-binding protein n=1 Tax=Vibrio viridaestus TaxID=2487322 RepID=A0A3N9TF26_9VIBR|nr:C4-dicarboxylate TRAP transporter substrate-binding protein [Vibrio viridaestus]RQW62640.1 C4-dicarboxylate ABC transporter substrate-binding protein [Vibrio viridaestus]
MKGFKTRTTAKLSGFLAASLLSITTAHAATSFIANSFYDQNHPLSKYGYIEWGKKLKQDSNGSLDPQIYTGTVLLSPRAAMQGIRDNVVQVASHAAIYTPSALPVANAIQELGFNLDDPIATILAVTDFSMNNPQQLAEWKKSGVVYLGAYTTPPYVLFCREPVKTLDEIKGKRIRAAGSTVSQWLEKVGAIPVNVASSEMYTGLDRGSLDCATNAANDLIDRSLWEVAKYTTMLPTGMYWSGPHWGVNPSFWKGLSDDQRMVFKKVTADSMMRMIVEYMKSANNAISEAKAKGNTVSSPSPELLASVEDYRSQALQNIYSLVEKKYGIKDGHKLIDSFMATYMKWKKLLKDTDVTDEQALAKLAEKEIYNKLPTDYGLK